MVPPGAQREYHILAGQSIFDARYPDALSLFVSHNSLDIDCVVLAVRVACDGLWHRCVASAARDFGRFLRGGWRFHHETLVAVLSG